MTQDPSSPTPSIALRLLFERASVPAGQSTESHLVVELAPRGEGLESLRPPLSVVFVLDLSGSMHGPPLEHVQSSVEMLINLLDPGDRAGIVGFSDDAAVIAELRPLDDTYRNLLKQRTRRLRADGATNISAGLEYARTVLGERQHHERQLALVLSDGRPNRGIADGPGLRRLVGASRPDIVTVALGYGPHHDEDVLSNIASAGSGEYFYIADPLEADDAFARAVGAQGDVIADAVSLAFQPRDGVEITGFPTHEKPRFGPGGLIIDCPDLLAGRNHYSIAALNLTPPAHRGPWAAIEATVRYRIAGTSTEHSHTETLSIAVTSELGEMVSEAHMRVLLAHAETARSSARALADRGQFDGAAAIIREFIETLEQTPGFKPGDGSVLADAFEQLIDERIAYERRPSAEAYRNFKRVNMGVSMQAGGWHHIDRSLADAKAQRIASGARGDLPSAYVVTDEPTPRTIMLTGETTVGRVRGNQIPIPIGSVSKRHARVVGRGGQYILVDLHTTNGTYLNGARITEPQVLREGDQFAIGGVTLRYHEGEPPDSQGA